MTYVWELTDEKNRRAWQELVGALQARVDALEAERDRYKALVKDAHFLRQNGERPPGVPWDKPEAETWADWDIRSEAALRGLSPAP